MVTAKRRYDEYAGWEHFRECSRQWRSIGQHRELLAAARSVVDQIDDPQRAHVFAQLDFAERTLDELDPLRHPELLVPDVLCPHLPASLPLIGFRT